MTPLAGGSSGTLLEDVSITLHARGLRLHGDNEASATATTPYMRCDRAAVSKSQSSRKSLSFNLRSHPFFGCIDQISKSHHRHLALLVDSVIFSSSRNSMQP